MDPGFPQVHIPGRKREERQREDFLSTSAGLSPIVQPCEQLHDTDERTEQEKVFVKLSIAAKKRYLQLHPDRRVHVKAKFCATTEHRERTLPIKHLIPRISYESSLQSLVYSPQ